MRHKINKSVNQKNFHSVNYTETANQNFSIAENDFSIDIVMLTNSILILNGYENKL